MLVLAGKNNIAVNALDYILENYNKDFLVVCNQTDDGNHGWQRSLKKTALDKGVKEITLEEAYEQASIFISLEFDKIVRPERFREASTFNIHFSLLPKYKGMYTSIWPLLNGEVVTGVTLHEIDNGIDTGSIIDQREIAISEHDRARDLYRKYLSSSFELFKSRFDEIISGEIYSKPQQKNASTYYSKKSIDFSTLKIDLNQTAHAIARQIYAFSFREYQLPIVMGEKIVEVDILDTRSIHKPGSLINKGSDSFDLATIDFDVRLYFDRIDRIGEFSNCTVVQAGRLLKGLCGVNDRNEHGWSPIIVAAYHGNFEVVDFLLEKGGDVNDTNNNGTSVLMYAKDFCIKANDRHLFDSLVARGADVRHKDFSGKQLVDYLSEKEKIFLGVK